MADPTGSTQPDVPSRGHTEPAAGTGPRSSALQGAWERFQHHKVLQWTLGYAATAYTLLHTTEMVSDALEWPHVIVRMLTILLFLAVPLVILLAWYHGHKAQHRISTGELSLLTVLLLIGAGLFWALTRPNQHAAERSVPTASIRRPSVEDSLAPAASVAVVPFANLTGDPSKEYFSDGMAEELINELTRVSGLKVPARTSSFAYKGRNIDIRQIARDLGVANILEGSVRSAGDRIRVTAQLVDAKSGYHLWSQSYDRRFADIFQMQDDLAAAIVEVLRSKMNPTLNVPNPSVPPTQDLQAYQLYLQASSVMPRMTEESFRSALDLYQQALTRDPDFARALAAMADLRLFFIRWGYSMPDAVASAEREAKRALALDPHLAQAQGVLGIAYATRGRWQEAERAFRQAFALDPQEAQARSAHAIFVLSALGQSRKGIEEASAAYHDAPANQIVVMRLAAALSDGGNSAEALSYMKLAIQMGYSPDRQPALAIRIKAALESGRYDEVGEIYLHGLSSAQRAAGGEKVVKDIARALADPSLKPTALAGLRSLTSHRWPDSPELSHIVAFALYAELGAMDEAFATANALVDEFTRTGEITPNTWTPLWDRSLQAFRRDPRFTILVGRLKLMMDYWEQYGPPDHCDLKIGKLTCR